MVRRETRKTKGEDGFRMITETRMPTPAQLSLNVGVPVNVKDRQSAAYTW
jgi:hypothetical protein